MRLRPVHLVLLSLVLAPAFGCKGKPVIPVLETPTPAPSATPLPGPTRESPEEKKVDLSLWPVDPPVRYAGRNYATVQKAIDAAKNGDSIELPQGIYDQPLVLSGRKGLTLRGLGDGAFFSISTPVGAAITVDRSSGITFERVLVRRAAVLEKGKGAGTALVLISDCNSVSFFHSFLDGAVKSGPDGDGVVVKGGASILLSDSFLRWANEAMLLDHVEGQVGIDRSIVSANKHGIRVKAPGWRFALNVRRSRIVNPAQNISVGNAKSVISDSVILLTKGAGDATPSSFPEGNVTSTDPSVLAHASDPEGADWDWEPARALLDADVAGLKAKAAATRSAAAATTSTKN